MKKVLEISEKISFPILCFTIFIIRLPPLYILPIKSAFLNSHSLARYLLLALTIALMVMIYFFKKTKFVIDKKLSIIILFYFITQSLSVLTAINIEGFLLAYKNIVFSLLIFYNSIVILDSSQKIEKLIKLLLSTVIINIILEFMIYFQPNLILPLLKHFSYGQYWDTLEANFRRQRFFVDMYDGALIPLLFYYFYYSSNNKAFHKIISLATIIAVSFFSLVSNFRSQLLMAFFSLIFSSFIFIRKSLMHFIPMVFLIFLLYVSYRSVISYNVTTALDRIVSPEEEEYATISIRSFFWSYSIDLALSSPFFGVGLGNFYDYLPSERKSIYTNEGWKEKLQQISFSHPHSIIFGVLAETGFLGLISLLVMLIYFFITDFILFRESIPLLSSSIISFWSLFIFALFMPPVTLPYLGLFWILRAMIVNINKLNI